MIAIYFHCLAIYCFNQIQKTYMYNLLTFGDPFFLTKYARKIIRKSWNIPLWIPSLSQWTFNPTNCTSLVSTVDAYLWYLLKYYVILLIRSTVLTRRKNILFTLENIGMHLEYTSNYFHCVALHKVKMFMHYAQGLMQLLLLIFTLITVLENYLHDTRFLPILTPFAWRYSTVFATICNTALASLSEKNRCLKILSNNSPPCISSVTIYTLLPLSNTCKIEVHTFQHNIFNTLFSLLIASVTFPKSQYIS